MVFGFSCHRRLVVNGGTMTLTHLDKKTSHLDSPGVHINTEHALKDRTYTNTHTHTHIQTLSPHTLTNKHTHTHLSFFSQ